ncbi:unnamed protein product [Closterium sp. NIES-54]
MEAWRATEGNNRWFSFFSLFRSPPFFSLPSAPAFTRGSPSTGVAAGGAPSTAGICPCASRVAPGFAAAGAPSVVAAPPPSTGGTLFFCAPRAACKCPTCLSDALLAKLFGFALCQIFFLRDS